MKKTKKNLAKTNNSHHRSRKRPVKTGIPELDAEVLKAIKGGWPTHDNSTKPIL